MQNTLNLHTSSLNDFEKKFSSIADDLLKNYIIKKGNTTYRFLEIEFYYYCSQHRDEITYPRKAKAGDWFFHASGVDICFESNVELDKETGKISQEQSEKEIYYGGILIRSLIKQDGNKTTYITGPLNCCYELFDKFSAFKSDDNFPRIHKNHTPTKSDKIDCCRRYFNFSTSLKDKYRSILKSHYQEFDSTKPDMIPCNDNDQNTFKKFLEKKYRFYLPKEFEKRKDAENDDKTKHYKTYNAEPGKKISVQFH